MAVVVTAVVVTAVVVTAALTVTSTDLVVGFLSEGLSLAVSKLLLPAALVPVWIRLRTCRRGQLLLMNI